MTAAHLSLDDLYRQFGAPERIRISYLSSRSGATAMDVEISGAELSAMDAGAADRQLSDASWNENDDGMFSLPLSQEIRELARARHV